MTDPGHRHSALSAVEIALAAATAALAVAGDPDDHQLAAYELAFAAAELAAARAAIDAAAPGSLDADLAALFAAEAAQSAATRLATVAADLGIDPPPPATPAPTARYVAAATRLAGGEAYGDVPLPPDAAAAHDAFRRFAAEVVAPLAADIHRRDLTVPEALLAPMREMGVFGLSIPARHGGSAPDAGEDNAAMVAVTEALSEASLAAAGSLITRPEILARALLAGGTDEQKARWLPRIAAGEPLCAIAITEPDYGSDVASLQLRATRTASGWRLDGAKTWCTFAGKAGLVMVVARTGGEASPGPRAGGHRGLSLFLVEKPSAEGHSFEHVQPGGGRLTGRAIPTIGYRGMHSFDLAFDGWGVPADAVIGGEGGVGRGFYLTMAGMTGGRMQTAARACGVMRAAVEAARAYAADRRVFGRALGGWQLTQVKLARIAARYAASRALAYRVAAMLDAGEGAMEASLVKLFACRSAEYVTREALQIHGGMGYAEESLVSRLFVDARVLSIFEGAEETLALKVVARGLIERARAAG